VRARTLAAGFVALALALGACSGGKKGEKKAGGSVKVPTSAVSQPPTSPPPAPPPGAPSYPLTGLPVTDAGRAARSALIIKIDNAPKARPQIGMENADIIFEEVVEGGVTRFLAMYQSQDPPLVGPVRSVRPIDPLIVTPFGGLFSYSGGAPKFLALIRKAPVQDIGFDNDPKDYRRDDSRPRPNNLFTTPAALYGKAAKDAKTPPTAFDFLKAGEVFKGDPIKGVDVQLGERTGSFWGWDPSVKGWRRTTNATPHVMADGVQLSPQNVIIQFVAYRNTGDVDVGGNAVPEAAIVGAGDAWVLSDGKIAKGKWSKGSAAELTKYTDAAGSPLKLSPGQTFVQFEPIGQTVALH
jgi:hypothetical protein